MTIDAAPATKPELLGNAPATLGPAFDGLALGQTISQEAAEVFLKQRKIDAYPYVRDGQLVSLHISMRVLDIPKQWPGGESWFDPRLHEHARETITEGADYLQFDLEVPIDRWLNPTLGSVVPFDLVTRSLDDAKNRLGPSKEDSYVDGHESVGWTDSALVGATTATGISVLETQEFRNTRRTAEGGWEVEQIPGAVSHGVYAGLDAPPATREAIEQRVTELYGKPSHSSRGQTWKHSKIALVHTPAGSGLEHVVLFWER